MKKLKKSVLIVYRRYWPNVGGVEKVVETLALGMRRRGWQVRILVCHNDRGPSEVRRIDGIPVIYASTYRNVMSLPLSLSFFALFRRLSQQADIVHWQEPFPLATLASFMVPAGKCCATYHADIVRQRGFRYFANLLMRLTFRRGVSVVATSNGLAKHSGVLSRLKKAANVIPIGVDVPAVPHSGHATQAWRDKYRIAGPYVLFVGRFVYYKGIDILLDAAALTDWPLVLIGRGPLENDVRDQISRLNLSGRVTVINEHVSDDELRVWFEQCKFFVLPSVEKSEAFGIVQIQAMAAGVPVINTALPSGVPDVSLDGISGLTVPPRSVDALVAACNKLWRDDTLCRQLGERGSERAATEFSSDLMIKRYEAIYDRMLEDGPAIYESSGRYRALSRSNESDATP